MGFHEPESALPPFTTFITVRTLIKPISETLEIVGAVTAMLQAAQTLAMYSSGHGSQTQVAEEKDAKTIVGGVAGGFKVLGKLGTLAGEEAEQVAAAFGAVSIVLTLLIEMGQAMQSIEEHHYAEATGHALIAVATILFVFGPETGGVSVMIAGPLIVAGVLLSSAGEIKQMAVETFTPDMKLLFEHRLNDFANGAERLGKYFPELAPSIAKVKAALEEVSWLEYSELTAYYPQLQDAGVSH